MVPIDIITTGLIPYDMYQYPYHQPGSLPVTILAVLSALAHTRPVSLLLASTICIIIICQFATDLVWYLTVVFLDHYVYIMITSSLLPVSILPV